MHCEECRRDGGEVGQVGGGVSGQVHMMSEKT